MQFSCGILVTPGRFQGSLPSSLSTSPLYTKASILYPCANVSVPTLHCHTEKKHPKYHHFSQFYSYGDHELKFPGDMSAICIYGRLEYIDTMRMTLCSIFSIKPFMLAYQPADPTCLLWSLTDPYIGFFAALLLLKWRKVFNNIFQTR